jgi:protease-4
MVRDRRHMDDAKLQTVTDGRVFSGRQGLELKLVDQLGNEQTALDWLAKEKGLKPDTPVRDWEFKSRFGDLTMLHLATRIVLEAVGLGGLAERIDALGSLQAVEKLNLDGLLALWHPPVSH